MAAQDEFRAALERGDFRHLRSIWRRVAPHLPQPADDAQAEIVMHRARTETETIPLRSRAWSHRWLVERGYPSGLPDALKPRAERIYPIVVEGVGIAVSASKPHLAEAAEIVRGAMSDAVAEAYADGRTDADFVSARMREARARAHRKLFGHLRGAE